jgi:hypothetical protein
MVIRKLLRGQRSPLAYSIVMIMSSTFIVVLIGFLYVKTAIERSEQKQCDQISIVDDYYQHIGFRPTGDVERDKVTREYFAAIHKLRSEYHCKPTRSARLPAPSPSTKPTSSRSPSPTPSR